MKNFNHLSVISGGVETAGMMADFHASFVFGRYQIAYDV